MDFEEFLSWLRDRLDEGEYATAETFLNDMVGGHDEYREASEARMREHEQAATDYENQISELKARNYDLLMKVPAAEGNDGDGVVVEDVDEDGTVYHIDNLFEDVEDEED